MGCKFADPKLLNETVMLSRSLVLNLCYHNSIGMCCCLLCADDLLICSRVSHFRQLCCCLALVPAPNSTQETGENIQYLLID